MNFGALTSDLEVIFINLKMIEYECQTKPFYSFYRKNQKKNASGEVPIYARIIIDGLKEELETSVKVRDENWHN
jgi:hypothetical protein